MKNNHKITIKNLGPIKLLENFEVKNINLFVGESATGKSLIAKAIFAFNDLFDKFYINDLFDGLHINEKSLKKAIEKNFEKLFFDYASYYVKYYYNQDCFIEVDRNNKKTKISFSEKLKGKIDFIAKRGASAISKRPNFQGKLYEGKLYELYIYCTIQEFKVELEIKDVIFITASRSYLIDFGEAILNYMTDVGGSLDNSQFDYMMLKTRKEFSHYKSRRIFGGIYKEFNKILRGSINYQNGDFSFNPDAKENKKNNVIGLQSLSSGQKEILPIAVILSKLIADKKEVLLIIEEPEAHLFPADQIKLFEILVYFANISNSKLIITTHSPYICYGANNMLLASKVEKSKKALEKAIKPQDCQVNFLKDGKAQSILEDGEIDTDYIDASNITLKEYHRLITKEDE